MSSHPRRLPICVMMFLSWSLTVLFIGCSGGNKGAELSPVVGVVKINGEPAANILVQFLPKVEKNDPSPTSTGVTNEKGEFELTTADGKVGAVVGPCKVLFVDMAEDRPPQGVEQTNLPRLSSALAIVGPRTREVVVNPESSVIDFDLKN